MSGLMNCLAANQELLSTTRAKAEANGDLAAIAMVRSQELKTALQNVGNIAGAPVAEYMGAEFNYEVLQRRLYKISELVISELVGGTKKTEAETKLRKAQGAWIEAKIEWSMALVAINDAKKKWEEAQSKFYGTSLVQISTGGTK